MKISSFGRKSSIKISNAIGVSKFYPGKVSKDQDLLQKIDLAILSINHEEFHGAVNLLLLNLEARIAELSIDEVPMRRFQGWLSVLRSVCVKLYYGTCYFGNHTGHLLETEGFARRIVYCLRKAVDISNRTFFISNGSPQAWFTAKNGVDHHRTMIYQAVNYLGRLCYFGDIEEIFSIPVSKISHQSIDIVIGCFSVSPLPLARETDPFYRLGAEKIDEMFDFINKSTFIIKDNPEIFLLDPRRLEHILTIFERSRINIENEFEFDWLPLKEVVNSGKIDQTNGASKKS